MGVLVESKRDRQNLDPAPTVLRLSSLFRLPWHVPSVLTQITNRTLDIQPYQFRPKFALSNSFARPNETRILTKFSAVIKFEYFPRSYSLLCDVVYSQVSRVDTPIESHAHFFLLHLHFISSVSVYFHSVPAYDSTISYSPLRALQDT